VWWDATLRAGEAYDEVTEAALRSAKAVVVLWSTRSVVSRWVRAEATVALRNGTLVPCMIEPCDRPIMFELTQTAELGHWQGDPNDAAWRAFLADVRRFVENDRQRDAPVARDTKAAVPHSAPQPPHARIRGLVIGAVASVVLALLGAMGTDAAPLGMRLLFWAAVIMSGSVFGLAVNWAMQKWGGLSGHRWKEAAVVAVLVAVPHTFVVIVASALMFGISSIKASTVIQFGLVVLLLSAVLTAINYLATPPAIEDVPSKLPVP
jgi:hypothetical protein